MLNVLLRGAAGAGATGASAPVEIWQRVRRTRPQNEQNGIKGFILWLKFKISLLGSDRQPDFLLKNYLKKWKQWNLFKLLSFKASKMMYILKELEVAPSRF